MAKPVCEREGICPFIDRNDARCDTRFSLSRLDQAFHVCMNGGYTRCPTYQLLASHSSPPAPGYAPASGSAGYALEYVSGYPRRTSGHDDEYRPAYLPAYATSARGPQRDADCDETIRLTLHGRTVSRTSGGSELRPTGS